MNTMQRETIIDNINDSFKNIGYTPEFADSEADQWLLISDNIRNFDSVHIFCNEKNNLPQTIENFYIKEGSPILFKYHYIPRNIEIFSNMISDLLNKIEKQHSKHKIIKTEVKEEIKVETKMNDNKSTSESRNKIGKLIKNLYKALIYLMFVINRYNFKNRIKWIYYIMKMSSNLEFILTILIVLDAGVLVRYFIFKLALL